MNDKQSFDDKLLEAARSLETEVTPPRDLWPEIETAIAKPARRPWITVFAQAAAVVLLVGVSSGLTYLVMENRMPSATPAGNHSTLNYEHASFGDQYTLGPDYEDARNGLKGRLDEELDRLSPEERVEVVKNLYAIRAAIEEINRALSYDPDSALLQELLMSSYREELELMKKVDSIANAAMYRTDI